MIEIIELPKDVDAETEAAWAMLADCTAQAQATADSVAAELTATRRVGVAVGLIMAEYKLTDVQAQALLDQLAIEAGKTTAQVAETLIAP